MIYMTTFKSKNIFRERALNTKMFYIDKSVAQISFAIDKSSVLSCPSIVVQLPSLLWIKVSHCFTLIRLKSISLFCSYTDRSIALFCPYTDKSIALFCPYADKNIAIFKPYTDKKYCTLLP